MDDNDDAPQQRQSGFLSPRRIEAIHIAFNNVFDHARNEGIIRDPSTYRTFDEVYEMAMKGEKGLRVEVERDQDGEPRKRRRVQRNVGLPSVDINEGNEAKIGRNVQVVDNSQEGIRGDLLISDDESGPRKRRGSTGPKAKQVRRRKGSIDHLKRIPRTQKT